jgi:zinc protease
MDTTEKSIVQASALGAFPAIKWILAFSSWLVVSAAWAGLPIQHWVTSSGAEVYLVETHELPMLDVAVNFAAGSSRDTRDKAGLAGLTQHMLSQGAGGLSDDQISRRMADLGAVLGGDLDQDRASLTLRTLSSPRESAAALELFARILQQPEFPPSVLEREQARIISSLREEATQPESIADRTFTAALYGDHPYGIAGADTPESVAAIKSGDLLQFYQRYYRSDGAVIAMIGDVSREAAAGIAEALAAGLPGGRKVVNALPPVPYPAAPRVERIAHPAAQSHILLGYPGLKRGDADYFPLYVGNYILGGGGFVSRLTEEVREKRGLVYSIYSFFLPLAELGPFQIGLQTRRDQADEALHVVRETLEKFIREGPSAREMQAAKDNIIGGFPLRIDSNGKILSYLSAIGFYHLPLTYLDDFNRQIARVTAAQVKDAFARRIKPDNMVLVIVGSDGK